MSAYENTNTNYQNQPAHLQQSKLNKLNENQDISATGLRDPHIATQPFVQGNTGSRRQENMTGTTPVARNKQNLTDTRNTHSDINTNAGSRINDYQGLEATGSTHGPNTGLSNSGYYNNTNDINTHQSNNDAIIHPSNSNELKYSGADINVPNLDQTEISNNNQDSGRISSTYDNSKASRHADNSTTNTQQQNAEHTIRSNTAPEGDHGASHHFKQNAKGGHHSALEGNHSHVPYATTGSTHATQGTGDMPQAPGSVHEDNQRHAGVPLHEGMGKPKPYHDSFEKDSLDTDDQTAATNKKPSAGDKIKGNLSKLAGKITGDESKVIKGDNIAHGHHQ